ncbi:hypothetical protein [Paenibacillus sp. GCM10027626]|uniref:hypothetical protein n=1 Tax=Paenibacillus sp. GCM10027626 TaxID=3273411 RepID=UPI00362EB504
MDELKDMITAILHRLEVESAKNEAFRIEMTKFQGEMRSNFKELQSQMDYLAGKLGQHDRDLYILRHNTSSITTEESY